MTKTHLSQILNKVVSISDRTYKSRVLRGMSEISPRSGDVAIFPIRGCLYHPLSLQLSPPRKPTQSTLCDSKDYLHSSPQIAAPVWYPWFCLCTLILPHLCFCAPVNKSGQTDRQRRKLPALPILRAGLAFTGVDSFCFSQTRNSPVLFPSVDLNTLRKILFR